MFYSALVTLVRNGLTDEDPALHGAYLNSYQVRQLELKLELEVELSPYKRQKYRQAYVGCWYNGAVAFVFCFCCFS